MNCIMALVGEDFGKSSATGNAQWNLVSAVGLEPTTHALKGHCSAN